MPRPFTSWLERLIAALEETLAVGAPVRVPVRVRVSATSAIRRARR